MSTTTFTRPRLRIVNHGDIAGINTKILLVDQDEDGNEVIEDLTTRLRVTRVTTDLSVGAASKATLECICVQGELDSLLDDIVVTFVGHSRWGRLTWRLRKWWWRAKPKVKDVTPLGKTLREYTDA